ncbi:hypothetical protein, partial [Pseudomonas viridiflava]|uniref:hypothetical protein n=1 Tax=Pseudomonas viridiflava TaxID=33069 RepID=UPI0019CFEDF7
MKSAVSVCLAISLLWEIVATVASLALLMAMTVAMTPQKRIMLLIATAEEKLQIRSHACGGVSITFC